MAEGDREPGKQSEVSVGGGEQHREQDREHDGSHRSLRRDVVVWLH
jgi:hypothetical protein